MRRRGPPALRCVGKAALLLLLLLLLGPGAAAASGRDRGGGRRSPFELSCRRLLQEFKDVMASGLALGVSSAASSLNNSTEHVRLAPCRGNLHEWHFTIAGPPGSVYEGGLFHGRVLLPADYPASAPRLQMLNPSGRFEVRAVGVYVCIGTCARRTDAASSFPRSVRFTTLTSPRLKNRWAPTSAFPPRASTRRRGSRCGRCALW